MRANRLRLGAVAAWLGMIALGLNALVPIHLAFDLAHALAGEERHDASGEHAFGSSLLELVLGHHDLADGTDSHRGHHHTQCAVCGSLGTLAGFALAGPAIMPLPVRIEAPTAAAAVKNEPHAAAPAAYRSRAPPDRIG